MPIKRNYTSNEVNKIIELYTNKLTLSEIGDYFKTSKNPIKRVLKENNIKIRTSGTQKGKPSKLKGIPKSESHKFNMRKPKYSNRLSDGTFYPPIPDLCHCSDINCNEIVYNGHDYIVGHQFRGMKRSDEWKKQQSERMLSDKNHLRGIKLSEEHKENIKKSAPHISGEDHWLYGKSLLEEHIKHLKESARRGEEHPKYWLEKHLSEEHIQKLKETSPHTSGKDHPNWKGGITKLKTQIWHSDKYNEWRTQIFIRDNRKCQECGSMKNVEAHHIKQISIIIKENNITTLEKALQCLELWDISNGITLCHKHHIMTDSYGSELLRAENIVASCFIEYLSDSSQA